MNPPYTVSHKILALTSLISEKIGEIKSARLIKYPLDLRKRNQIKTIQSSLEIEGNSLTVEQITDLINHKRVLGKKKDITEVKNALKVYSMTDTLDVYKLDSLCKAHEVLMTGLVDEPGKLRTTSVGIARGDNITHVAPPGKLVPSLMNELFDYLRKEKDLALIKSCVFHYELEFIHPFVDGNGRIGRLWQSMILKEYSPIFEFLPIETLIKERQQDYYGVLASSDKQGNSTGFIEFMLEIIDLTLEDLLFEQNLTPTNRERMDVFRSIVGERHFSRKDYLRHNKDISTATASRDLKMAVDRGILKKTGEKRLTKYYFRIS